MNRVFECTFIKRLNQVVATQKNVSAPRQSTGSVRIMQRASIALAVALLGACASDTSGSNYAVASNASGNPSTTSEAPAGQRA